MLDGRGSILLNAPMKALPGSQYGGPEVVRLEDLPEPKAGPGQVVVRVKAVGVNPVDVSIRNGAYAKIITPPHTPGSAAAGRVAPRRAPIRTGAYSKILTPP